MDLDVLFMADIEQMWIRRGELCVEEPRRLRGDAVGQADGAASPVVATGSQPPGCCASRRIDDLRVEEAKLREVECSLLLMNPDDADQVIEHFGDTHDSEGRWLVASKKRSNLGRGRFSLEEREDRIRIEDDHRPRSPSASRRRAC